MYKMHKIIREILSRYLTFKIFLLLGDLTRIQLLVFISTMCLLIFVGLFASMCSW